MNLHEREKKLLTLLLEQKEYQPASYFTEKLGVSAKTIYKDVEEIKPLLKQYDLTLSKVPRKGIYITGNDEQKALVRLFIKNKTADINSYAPSYRKLFIFSQILFNDKTFSYQYYADYFFVSIQSIKKDFDSILNLLKNKGIAFKKDCYDLEDAHIEADIQQIFKEYLERYQESTSLTAAQEKKIFGDDIPGVVQNYIETLQKTKADLPNEYLFHSLKNTLLILLNRLKIDRHLTQKSGLLFNRLENMQLYMTALALSNQCSSELGIIFQNADIYYLCSLLLAHGIAPSIQDNLVQEKIHHTIDALIKRMSMMIDCDLTKDTLLYHSLLSHIVPMIYRLKIGIDVKNPLKEQIIKQYSTMHTLISYSITQIEKDFSLKMTDDEISFLTIHFQLAFEKVRSVKHVLIICPLGLGTSQLIYQRIKQSMPSSTILEIIDLKSLATADLTKVDLLISTVQLPKQDIPLVYASVLPTYDEISHINNKLSNIQANEKNFMHHISADNSFASILDEAFVFLKFEAKNQEDIIDFLAEQYTKNNYVTDGFRAAIYERESLGTTGFASGVAIPHADPATVLKTKPAVMTLKSPVKWGANDISLVILLAISENDITTAKTMLASIYDLISSPARVQALVSSTAKSEVIQIVLNEGTKKNG